MGATDRMLLFGKLVENSFSVPNDFFLLAFVSSLIPACDGLGGFCLSDQFFRLYLGVASDEVETV